MTLEGTALERVYHLTWTRVRRSRRAANLVAKQGEVLQNFLVWRIALKTPN